MGIAFKTARQRAAQALNGSLGTEASALMEPDDAKFLDGFCTSEEDSQLMTFVASYVAQKVTNCSNRPGVSKICENVFLAGQLSEEELQSLATKEGCKSVLNMRRPEEAGQFGIHSRILTHFLPIMSRSSSPACLSIDQSDTCTPKHCVLSRRRLTECRCVCRARDARQRERNRGRLGSQICQCPSAQGGQLRARIVQTGIRCAARPLGDAQPRHCPLPHW